MKIRVNGESRSVEDGMTVAALLAELDLEPLRCAVERNRQLIPRARHSETVLNEADELEIVSLVGGG